MIFFVDLSLKMKARPSSEKGLIHNIGDISNRWEMCFPKSSACHQFSGQYKNQVFCFVCFFAHFALKEIKVVMCWRLSTPLSDCLGLHPRLYILLAGDLVWITSLSVPQFFHWHIGDNNSKGQIHVRYLTHTVPEHSRHSTNVSSSRFHDKTHQKKFC